MNVTKKISFSLCIGALALPATNAKKLKDVVADVFKKFPPPTKG